MYHANPPTGWTQWEGPLRPRAIDTTKLEQQGVTPWDASLLLHNSNLKVRVWNSQQSMDHLVRNGDGDEVLFIHQGCGQLFCDYGHLSFHDGDYIVIPRATSWRIDIEESVSMLLIEATNSGYQMAERGLVGQHAIYDPAILEYARIDKAFF